MAQRTCSIEGCENPLWARGWCSKHYTRWRRHGDPLAARGRKRRPASERLVGKYRVDADGCWRWTGAISTNGYGRIQVDGECGYAHRVSYEAHVGPIPPDMTIDHLCFEKTCIRPDHLQPVSNTENIRRYAQTITHCPQGHPYSTVNTYLYWDKQGRPHRICRTCRDRRVREFRERASAA